MGSVPDGRILCDRAIIGGPRIAATLHRPCPLSRQTPDRRRRCGKRPLTRTRRPSCAAVCALPGVTWQSMWPIAAERKQVAAAARHRLMCPQSRQHAGERGANAGEPCRLWGGGGREEVLRTQVRSTVGAGARHAGTIARGNVYTRCPPYITAAGSQVCARRFLFSEHAAKAIAVHQRPAANPDEA